MSNQIIKTTVTHPYFAVESHELDSLLLPNYIQNSQDAINYIRSNKKLQKTSIKTTTIAQKTNIKKKTQQKNYPN